MGSSDLCDLGLKISDLKCEVEEDFGPNLKILPTNDQVKELQTILRDRNTTRSDFKFYADRLIRLVIEESLNQLPFYKSVVTTPTGARYEGLKYQKGNCGVSIVRSGEAMEQGLRDCCRSIRIGKILVESDVDTHEARVVYARFPEDIADRKVLLMYPIMSTGNTVIKAVAVLKEHNVLEENIIVSNLFCTPFAASSVISAYPQMRLKQLISQDIPDSGVDILIKLSEDEGAETDADYGGKGCGEPDRLNHAQLQARAQLMIQMKILTSELHHIAPNHFGQKYFGTD